MKNLLSLLLVVCLLCGCREKETTSPIPVSSPVTTFPHPAWVLQGNVYEVNVRQYTPEGTLRAFAAHLDRLRDMGVQTVWFMPLNPISKKDRKGTLGSYYAVSDYTKVNPEFGSWADWQYVVDEIHKRGMKVIIDWVPNHTGADNRWLTQHPDFFVKDSTGQPAMAQDWADTRQLDYTNPVMQDSMINAMKFWLVNSDIDGFRCDVAWNVPGEFWSTCITQLKQVKDVFMLAEGDKAYLAKSGFDAVYPWRSFHMMRLVAKGERPAYALDSVKADIDTLYLPETIQLYFTSNHDENSWNQSDHGLFPGPVHAPFAVFTQTMDNSMPLIYSGQEEPLTRALQFFEKDLIGFDKYERAAFYKTLLTLRRDCPALATDASFRKTDAGDKNYVYAYVREKGNERVAVVLNFSAQEQTITLSDTTLHGTPVNVFTGARETLTAAPWTLKPWGYAVFRY